MKCKLCLQEKPLLKKSHIIPDFMYHGLFDEKHFIAPLHLHTMEIKKKLTNGAYDADILCKECDNELLGKLETFARIALWGGLGNPNNYPIVKPVRNQFNQKILSIKNIDYCKFKLFLLSILWRASISKHKIFNQVDLGVHEEIIRKMIFGNDPDSSLVYPVGLFLFEQNNTIPTKFITEPRRLENESDLSFIFIINGMLIYFIISGDNNSLIYDSICIKEDNTMSVYILEEDLSVDFIDFYLNKKLRYRNA